MASRAARLITLAISVVGLWAGAAPAGANSQGPASEMGALEHRVLANVNALRHEHGLGSLRFSLKLAAAARSHSAEMAEYGYFSHDSVNGSAFDKRIGRHYPLRGSPHGAVREEPLVAHPAVGR